jgi:hypothetical protein
MNEKEYQNQNRITFIAFLVLLFFIIYLFFSEEKPIPDVEIEVTDQAQEEIIDSNPFKTSLKEEHLKEDISFTKHEIIEEESFDKKITYVNFDFQNSHIDEYFMSSFRNPSDFNNGVYLLNDFFELYDKAGIDDNYVFSGNIVDSFGNIIEFSNCSTKVTNLKDDESQKKWINCENKDTSEKLNIILKVFKDPEEDIRDYEVLYIYEYIVHENESFPVFDTQIALFPMNDNNGVVFLDAPAF